MAEKASVLSLALLRAAALGAHEGGEARRGVPVAVAVPGRGRGRAVPWPCRAAPLAAPSGPVGGSAGAWIQPSVPPRRKGAG